MVVVFIKMNIQSKMMSTAVTNPRGRILWMELAIMYMEIRLSIII